ncbi:pyridoxal phosphate-dependent aminotransferase [Halobacillus locisalis]|uniref:cysteine-S-conjugate beta-lyase n=1 Tax=Halobacillus locisalis TaxID=220753 RepID=A0A838CV34_9BACI|nr:MalY/PatB family protein [Halobacillus locisalis]MBA2175778.1 pyridoxal phosphate-dependent aminotransferase [Halobacillus locisalis]
MNRFEQVTPRKGTRSVKWDLLKYMYKDEEVLPMWVADMDFKTPEAVTEAISKRVEHGIFGYTWPDEDVKAQIKDWIQKRHDWEVQPSWITYSPGVIPSLHMIVQSLTDIADHVLIQTPVYPPFYSVVKDHGRHIVKNPLQFSNGQYTIDFEDFEEKIKENDVKMFILCNPHNPVGRVWTQDELTKMKDICVAHDVLIVADEIHADLVYKNHKHIPMASLSEEANNQTITCLSPTKTFNLAGLQASYVITSNEEMRKKLDKQFHNQGMMMLNTLGLTALESAYKCGADWLDELLETLETNRDYVEARFHEETDTVQVIHAEGTYLLWLDCRDLGMAHEDLKTFMQEKAKVGLNDGASFGDEGEGFMRINIAAPFSIVEEGVTRIINAVHQL